MDRKGVDLEKTYEADEAMFQARPIASRSDSGHVVPSVHVLWATPDPLGAIAAMCRMYEGKPTYNLADITDEEREHYWEQVNATHLKAPLESVKMHFFIEGVTRSFTHQMVRQRTAVYAQESMRFAVKEDMASEAAMPPSIQAADEGMQDVWRDALKRIQKSYDILIEMGVPGEDARGLLPHATTTRLNYVTDLRALLEHAGNRLCTQAQFEWRAVFLGIMDALENYDPPIVVPHGDVTYDEIPVDALQTRWQWKHIVLSDVFKPVCFKLGHCPFTAVFDRQCTIRERVQTGRFNEIHPSEYLADPTAGRRD